MIYGDFPIYEKALVSHEEHGRRLNYPVSVLRDPIIDGVWNKPLAILSIILRELEKPLDQRLQWIFWFDSDTVLMNLNLPLETFIPPPYLSEIHILLSKDWNGINNGNFFIRVHPWSVKLLNAVISYPYLHQNANLPFRDQSALSNVINENKYFTRSVAYCPSRWFNPYRRSENGELPITEHLNPDMRIHPGDLLVHFPGIYGEALDKGMKPYIDISAEERPEWNKAVEETGYIEETSSFWEDFWLPPIEEGYLPPS
ncbi:galactosyl transferase GMA12/MNN10 family protein [Penicillium macrosclerotiorum]|uniref:galactosyl transferase GMA12/MNN10 family protein n=1 Tax=Penicillium macrosclerotiorum TaxID=303699 RepID=UPI0025469C29|nr:galactosyl transferase GMA12/MNN10 family protein [Penicillium macrosclerotiorum]KAJ5689009.1 galactosyl transferase GMA12/MNN10 family protein [Penicillium macrosclerotiorum]